MDSEQAFHFPFKTFTSAAGFRDFCAANQSVLDLRYSFETERAQAVKAPSLIAEGSCGLCLQATIFSTQLPSAGGGEPNWREQQICGCPDQLNCRFRAMLHFIAGDIAPPPWTKALLLGAAQSIESRLQRKVAQVAVRARSGRLLRAPRFEQQAYHLILSCDHLQAEAELDEVLEGLRDALLPGGRLLFTASFDTARATSLAPSAGQDGVLGWDILARLGRAGFARPAAHLFWSAEFGYLGTFNLLFSAFA